MFHRNLRNSIGPLAFTLLLAAPLATPAHAGDHSSSRGQAVIDLALPLSLFSSMGGSLGGSMTLSCDTDVDARTRAALRALDTQGGSGRYAWTDEDGSRLVAQRNGGRFRLRVTDDDDQTVSLEMPWGVAQCLFSGDRSGRRKMSLASLQRDGGFSLKVSGEDASFHVQMK